MPIFTAPAFVTTGLAAALLLGSGLSHASGLFNQCLYLFPASTTPAHKAAPGQRDLCFSEFAVLHSAKAKTPLYVVERLSARSLAQGKDLKRTDKFYEEARLPKAERAVLKDYAKSGYDRGHLAAAANRHTPEGMAQSFSLANMAPMLAKVNRGTWAEVESATRKFIRRAAGDVFVFTGVVPSAKKTTPSGQVNVPSHLYKLVYDQASGRAWAFWVPHTENAKIGKPISYQDLKAKTNIDFLPGIAVKN